MDQFSLEPIWKGRDVFILGGGPSVKTFPIERLRDVLVIGCNDAYQFGAEIIDVLVFGDQTWYEAHEKRLAAFPFPIVTNCKKVDPSAPVSFVEREPSGFHKKALGWNGNTGAVALNLALILGARKVYLIGFDMKLGEDGESNWHPNELDKVEELHYERYRKGFEDSVQDIAVNFPGVAIINLNPDSKLTCFPRMSWETVFGKEQTDE